MHNDSTNGCELSSSFYKRLQGNTRGSLCLMYKCKCCSFPLICLYYRGRISGEHTLSSGHRLLVQLLAGPVHRRVATAFIILYSVLGKWPQLMNEINQHQSNI